MKKTLVMLILAAAAMGGCNQNRHGMRDEGDRMDGPPRGDRQLERMSRREERGDRFDDRGGRGGVGGGGGGGERAKRMMHRRDHVKQRKHDRFGPPMGGPGMGGPGMQGPMGMMKRGGPAGAPGMQGPMGGMGRGPGGPPDRGMQGGQEGPGMGLKGRMGEMTDEQFEQHLNQLRERFHQARDRMKQRREHPDGGPRMDMPALPPNAPPPPPRRQ